MKSLQANAWFTAGTLVLAVVALTLAGCSEERGGVTGPDDSASLRRAPLKAPGFTITDESGRAAESGPGTKGIVELYAEDFENGPAGWVARDLSVDPDIHWHHVYVENPGGGDQTAVWYCGEDCSQWVAPPGYGNDWIQDLARSYVLDKKKPEMRYEIQFDTEANYDFVYVQVSADGGETWETKATHHGRSDGFETHQVDLSGYEDSIVMIRFRFCSDGGYSDQDGDFDSDGACRLASVKVSGHETEKFSEGTCGWTASVPPGIGGGPFRLETYLAGLGDGQNHAWAAYDQDTGMFPFIPDEEAIIGRILRIGIESPAIAIPPNAVDFILEFDIYRDLPLFNFVFFSFEVAARYPGEEGWVFMPSWAWVYGGSGWERYSCDLDYLMPDGAVEMKIRLTALDIRYLEWVSGIPFSGIHTAAPFFDNVRVTAGMP